MVEFPRWRVLQLSREDEREGLLPDCRVGVKESESEHYPSWMHWQHTRQLTFWTMVQGWCWIAWQAPSDSRTAGRTLASGTRSYIASILLLDHGLTVKLRPCPCSHSSLAGQIAACVGIPNAICYSLRLALGGFSILLVVLLFMWLETND